MWVSLEFNLCSGELLLNFYGFSLHALEFFSDLLQSSGLDSDAALKGKQCTNIYFWKTKTRAA